VGKGVHCVLNSTIFKPILVQSFTDDSLPLSHTLSFFMTGVRGLPEPPLLLRLGLERLVVLDLAQGLHARARLRGFHVLRGIKKTAERFPSKSVLRVKKV
jgi:hypothetical protein